MSWSRLRFAQKVTLLIALLTAVSGITITSVTVYAFRHELYDRELSSAFTVYMAAANYLTGHYKSQRNQFNPSALDYVFRKKFLRLEGAESRLITHRPSHIAVYDGRGELIYEYTTDAQRAPRFLTRPERPVEYRQWYDPHTRTIHNAGLVAPGGDVPGFVHIIFPSGIADSVAALYRHAFAVTAVILLAAVGLSLILARRTLRPIEQLIRAAQRVHDGDLDLSVIVTAEDEIGLLAETFNEMVASLGRRLTLMRQAQSWTMELSGIFELDRLGASLLEMCRSLSGSNEAALFIAAGDGEHLAPADAAGPLALDAFRESRPRFLGEDGAAGPEPARPVEIALPLLSGPKRIGVIWIGRPADTAYHDEETVTILQTLAQHAAVAIENVRLYRKLSEKQRIEREMALARQIQTGLLPRSVPQIPGYDVYGACSPATEVGGDYFDYVSAGGGRWHLLVGDVSGKGVAAALIVSIVRSLTHTFCQTEKSARRVLARVNENLSPDLKSDMFVTIAALTIGGDDRSAWLVRAGHEPAVVLRAGGAIERVKPGGTAVGLMDNASFENLLERSRILLAPGDLVLLYTDGITEATNAAGECFGAGRLDDAVRRCAGRPAKESVESVLADVARFSGDRAPFDDITLVVARRTA